MKVLIINQHTLNFGDDIAGIALINNLLEYEKIDRIDIIYNTKGKLLIENKKIHHNEHIMLKNIGYSNIIKYFIFRRFGYKNYKNKALKDMLEIINQADYIYVSPCGANIGIYKDWRFLIKLLIVIQEGKKPIFHLNTIGKSNSIIFDLMAKKVLKKSIIYVREKKSLEYIESLGLNAKFGVDTAFSFKDNEIVEKKQIIAFVPTILKNWHPNFKNVDVDRIVFKDILPIIAEFANSKKLPIQLIPHLNSIEEEEYYKRIVNEFNKLNVEVYYRRDVDNVYKYNKAIKESKLLLGMRYHSIVLAIKNQIPFIALSYENKMQEVCDYSNMSQYSFKLYDKKIDKDEIRKKLEYIYNNEENICKDLNEILEEKLIKLSRIPLEQIKL